MRRALIFVVFAMFIVLPAMAQDAPLREESITPDQLWSAMLQGNKQYMAGKIVYDNLQAERTLLVNGQLPPITVLACSDSRVPPELVFNQSLGALFVVRTAGNVADELGLASIEYALSNRWTKLIVVLAHEDCGAVKASLGTGDPAGAPLSALALRIRSSFAGIPYDANDKANVKKATEANARASAAQLLAGSKTLRGAVIANQLKVVSAYCELGSGEVKKIE